MRVPETSNSMRKLIIAQIIDAKKDQEFDHPEP